VFRLIKESGYHKLDDFSSPEMHRASLEKEILKLKIWNQGEPDQILGRAIQPPAYAKILKTITNLLDSGALTIPTEKDPSGVLTELGKIYAELPLDLKHSRLLMIANAFDLITSAVIVVSILAQDKRIFRNDDIYHTSLYKEMLNKEGAATDCDFLLMINTYLHWRQYLPPHYQNAEHIDNKYKIPFFDEEDEFCRECCLNKYVLREVHINIYDLIRRLGNLGIVVPKTFTSLDENSTLLFKIALAGAFYPRFIKCEIDEEKITKTRYKKLDCELHRMITVKK
jgi:HrpA-like RNA helicase